MTKVPNLPAQQVVSYSFQRSISLETKRRRSTHVNLIILLSPLNEQISPRKCHPHTLLSRSWDLPRSNRRHDQRTRPGPACQRRPSTTFPNLHLQMRRTHHLHKFYIRLGREDASVSLQRRSITLEIDIVFQIVHEDDGMGISHGDHGDFPFLAVAGVGLFEDGVVFGVGWEGGGDGGSVEDGFAHVDGDCFVRVHYRDDGAGEGVDTVGFGVFSQILQKLSKATDAISTHFWFGSIAIVDSHGEVIFVLLTFGCLESEDDSISTDAKVAVAKSLALIRRQRRSGLVAIIDQNKVISKSFVLGEFDHVSRLGRQRG
mmetsp:Transcript_19116/g.32845  ORF Transcript_19116/g.32845 Transcript_19116/m.32845 type:complete len:316 (-) Transcript_19116:150-1097(-)